MCCCFTTIYEKRAPGCTKIDLSTPKFTGRKTNVLWMQEGPRPKLQNNNYVLWNQGAQRMGWRICWNPRNPIPGQSEQAGSEVCELAILMSSTKARQQTRQRITHSYSKAHKQQQTDLFPSHPIFFLDFQMCFLRVHCFAHNEPFQNLGLSCTSDAPTIWKNECQKTDESWRVPSV